MATATDDHATTPTTAPVSRFTHQREGEKRGQADVEPKSRGHDALDMPARSPVVMPPAIPTAGATAEASTEATISPLVSAMMTSSELGASYDLPSSAAGVGFGSDGVLSTP